MFKIKKHIVQKPFFALLLVILPLLITAQQTIPPFTIKQTLLVIPAFLPGIMADSSASLINDTLIYTLPAKFFENKEYKIPLNKPAATLATPWETLVEMADAYSKKSTKRIISLYAKSSKEKITRLLSSAQAPKILDLFSKAAKANLTILGGFQYKDGFMTYTKDDVYGVHQNYLIKEDGKYKLSALDDKAPTAWNVALYFKFDPKPLIPLQRLDIPDSLNLGAAAKIHTTLPEAKRWIAVYMNEPGAPVMLIVQDNGINDGNPAPRQVTFSLDGELFINKGTYQLYTASFNYPVQRVSSNMITDLALHTINIK